LARQELSASQISRENVLAKLSPLDRELDYWQEMVPVEKEIDCDILAYWQKMEKTLPLLARLARRVFAIPVTSASSERVFSEGGNVISKSRTLLAAYKAEDLIFIQQNYENVAALIKRWKLRARDFAREDKVDNVTKRGSLSQGTLRGLDEESSDEDVEDGTEYADHDDAASLFFGESDDDNDDPSAIGGNEDVNEYPV